VADQTITKLQSIDL